MATEFRDALINRIRTVMRLRGMTQAQIADGTGYSADRISKWLRPSTGDDKDRTPSLEQLARIAAALRTSCDYLLGLVENAAPPAPDRHRLPRARVESALQKISLASEDLRQALAANEEAPTASATSIDSAPYGARPLPATHLFDESLEDDGATSRRRSTDEGNDSTL